MASSKVPKPEPPPEPDPADAPLGAMFQAIERSEVPAGLTAIDALKARAAKTAEGDLSSADGPRPSTRPGPSGRD